jgi:hypothetical protein
MAINCEVPRGNVMTYGSLLYNNHICLEYLFDHSYKQQKDELNILLFICLLVFLYHLSVLRLITLQQSMCVCVCFFLIFITS